jgi:chromosome segregation ATPase
MKVMAARKTTSRSRSSSATRQVAVLLEDVRSQFGVFGEALHGLRETVERQFEQIERRFEQIDRRFEQIDRRFERVEGSLGLLKVAVLDNSRELSELRRSIDERLDRKVDRDEIEGLLAGHHRAR